MQHPDDKDLQLFVAGQLDAEKEKTVEEHLAQCPECSKRISELELKPQDPLMQNMKAVAAGGTESSEAVDPMETVDHAVHLSRENPLSSDLFTGGDVLGGNLRLEEKLGRGGMGEAWKASDLMAGRDVVIKLVPPEIRHAEAAMGQVRETFQKVHALQHQHICPMMSLNDDPTYGLYVVMKFIDGKTLDVYRRDYIRKHGRFPLTEILRILWDVARALDYSHERKVLHRDVKPQNIMISPEDGVQLIDFGLAAEIRSSMMQFSETPMDIAGTRPYMAPEQWRGRLQDAKTDQYALAVTAYELIAGRQPFQGTDVAVLRECVLNEQPEPIPGIPDHINAALTKAMSKKRDDRFPDCRSFVRALNTKPTDPTENVDPSTDVVSSRPSDQPSDQEGVVMPPPVIDPMPKNPKRRTKVWTIVFGVAACAALLGVLGFLSSKPSQRPDVVVQSETPKQEKEPVVEPVKEVSEPSPEPLKLTDDEKRSLQQKYLELDWKDANVVVLPEPTEDAVRQALEKAAETKENDFIVVRTTKEKHRIVLKNGVFEIRHSVKDKGSVVLISLGPEKLTLDGDKKGRIVLVKDKAEADFAGIVFTNGFVIDDVGAAILARNGVTVRFFHCDFIDNACQGNKKTHYWEKTGGCLCCAENSALVLRNVLFEGNRIHDPETLKTNTLAEGGTAGIFLPAKSSLVATNVVFRNNEGGALLVDDAPFIEMKNISLIGNKASKRATVYLRPRDTKQIYRVTNLFATGNEDASGVILITETGRFFLDHLTLVDNAAPSAGSVCIGRGDGHIALSNSIVTGHRSEQGGNLHVDERSQVRVHIRNCIFGKEADKKDERIVFDQNNRFLNRDDLKLGELRDFGNGAAVMLLLEGSPAIDAGVVTENTPETDVTGRPRNVGKAPDVGAFEWQGNAATAPENDTADPMVEERSLPQDLTQEEQEHLKRVLEKLPTLPDAKTKITLSSQRVRCNGQFSPDGKKFVATLRGSGNGCHVFDPATGKSLLKVDSSSKLHRSGFHPDGRMVATATEAGGVLLWNLENGEIFREIKAHEKKCWTAQFGPDGTFFASGSYDNTAAVWDTATGEERRRLTGHTAGIVSLEISPDGKRLATGSEDRSVRIWDIETGRELYRLFGPDQSAVHALAYNHQGTILASGYGNGMIAFWDAKTGRPIKRFVGGSAYPIAIGFSPDDSLLVSGGHRSNDSFVWDVETGMPVYRLPMGQGRNFTAVFSPDGGSVALTSDGNPTVIWEISASEEKNEAVQTTKVPTNKPKPVEPQRTPKTQTPATAWRPTKNELAAAPAEFQKRGKEIQDEIEKNGGFAVAGQVVEKNGAPMRYGTYSVALKYDDFNAGDTYRYANGWFITRVQKSSKYDKVVATTFQHDEVEMPLNIEEGKVTFCRVFMERTPKSKLATLQGIVKDENGRPIGDAEVGVTVERSNGYFESPLSTKTVTETGGRYYLSNITPQEYHLRISSKQHSGSYAFFSVRPGDGNTKLVLKNAGDGLSRQDGERIVTTILFPRKVTIDAVYQPDGSLDFTGENVIKNQYELWSAGNYEIAVGDQKAGRSIIFDPNTKKNQWGYYTSHDLTFEIRKGNYSFRHFYQNNIVGHYDLGDVDFDSVSEAEPARIQRGSSLCELNHVYVVRTYEKGHYAKFVVRSIGSPVADGAQGKPVEKTPVPEEEEAEEDVEEEEETDQYEKLLLKDLPIPEEDSKQRRLMRWATFSSMQKKYENSLFASAPSKQLFRPDKQWKTFKARFGLAKGSANCTFIVNGDGRELYRSEVVQDLKARPLVVNIQDVEVLELVVERGDDGRKAGLAYWFTPTLSQNGTLKETPENAAVEPARSP